MRFGGHARVPEASNNFTFADALTGFDVEVKQMPVSRLQAVAMIDANIVSVAAPAALRILVVVTRDDNGSRRRGMDRLSNRSPVVDARMQTHSLGQRMNHETEFAADLALGGMLQLPPALAGIGPS